MLVLVPDITGGNSKKLTVTSYSCRFVDYGDVERRCTRCGYVIWKNGKTDNEVLIDMISHGYPLPGCKTEISNGVE